MTTVSTPPAVAHHHGPPTTFISKYVFSTDHKVIGKQYLGLALVAVTTGMVLSWYMRFHLASSGCQGAGARHDHARAVSTAR